MGTRLALLYRTHSQIFSFLVTNIYFFQGKGTIVSYFLCGKDGFDKPLPNLKEAASLEEHEFK